ncbi:hypothetical protein ACH42_09735 [Endozoicomonas sp. (ex Bugula neritina AB1)]|nr:hypothetical protein ACH42_09735 [Endozoicomonas sp. (ex Bugula neritina AB1)]
MKEKIHRLEDAIKDVLPEPPENDQSNNGKGSGGCSDTIHFSGAISIAGDVNIYDMREDKTNSKVNNHNE